MRKTFSRKIFFSIIWFLSLGVFLAYSIADNAPVSGIYGFEHSTGVYSAGGNAGLIDFNVAPTGYSGAQITKIGQDVYLTGIFWSQTVGWMSFSDSPMLLVPPPAGSNVRDPWYLSGLVWSPNAWWIRFNHDHPDAENVAYLPDTGHLAGQAWSDQLGWIPFGEVGTGIEIQIADGFIGKVSIDGQIWGSKTFNVLYDPGGSFDTASMTEFVNIVRKNVSFLLRNAGSKINTSLTVWPFQSFRDALIWNIEDNPSANYLSYSTIQSVFDTDLAKTWIVVGADIFLDDDVLTPLWLDAPRAIIALKNEKGEWGNIFIRWSVKRIQSTLFAEASVLSWEDTGFGLVPYYQRKQSLFMDMPPNQLWIQWSVAGYNTIGWWSKDDGAICPRVDDDAFTCTYDTAIKYDWNYFRIFDGAIAHRAYTDDTKDDFSIIIQYDPRVLMDPPPGLADTMK